MEERPDREQASADGSVAAQAVVGADEPELESAVKILGRRRDLRRDDVRPESRRTKQAAQSKRRMQVNVVVAGLPDRLDVALREGPWQEPDAPQAHVRLEPQRETVGRR